VGYSAEVSPTGAVVDVRRQIRGHAPSTGPAVPNAAAGSA